MIEHRCELLPRPASSDAVQNDMEFYAQYYQDEYAKEDYEIIHNELMLGDSKK